MQKLFDTYSIGNHLPKLKTLELTIQSYSLKRPYQIFLGNPQSTSLNIPESDLVKTYDIVKEKETQYFIHSPYIINLAKETDYQLQCLEKNLTYGVKSGSKGVVVHVGKSTTLTEEDALENMYENVVKGLNSATETCPLLLETPAGQGTELLCDIDDFISFVQMVDDRRLRICVDTCHVFACGYDPYIYIKKVLEAEDEKESLLHLIHFNDSLVPCGAKKDRHALPGTGYIGLDKMERIAELCKKYDIAMLNE